MRKILVVAFLATVFVQTDFFLSCIYNQYLLAQDINTGGAPAVTLEFDPFVFFEHASSKLRQEEHDSIVQTAAIIKLFPDAYVVVKGHADKREGSREFCQKLSEERAQLVQTILVISGLRSDRIVSVGEGFNGKSTFSDANRKRLQKRRVDIVLTKNLAPLPSEKRPSKKVAKKPDALTHDVQVELTMRSYDPGPVDGFMGNKTRTAIKQFQKDSNIAVTGRPDQNTLTALGLKEGNVQYNEPTSVPPLPPQPQSKTDSGKKQPQTVINRTEERPAPQKMEFAKGAVIETTSLFLEPNFMADTIQSIAAGQQIELLEKKGQFYKAKHRGQIGYIYSDFVKVTD